MERRPDAYSSRLITAVSSASGGTPAAHGGRLDGGQKANVPGGSAAQVSRKSSARWHAGESMPSRRNRRRTSAVANPFSSTTGGRSGQTTVHGNAPEAEISAATSSETTTTAPWAQ